MATIIRSPKVKKNPRRLQDDRVTRETKAILSDEAGDQDQAVSMEMLAELKQALKVSESRLQETEQKLEVLYSELQEQQQQAQDEGYKEGYQEGLEKASTDSEEHSAVLRQKLAAAEEFLKNIDEQLMKLVLQSEAIMVEIIYEAIAKIIGEKLSNTDTIVAMIKSIAKQAISREKLIIHISPQDYQSLANNKSDILKNYSAQNNIDIIPDEKVEISGCYLETDSGSLDARLEVQLERLKDVLLTQYQQRLNELTG